MSNKSCQTCKVKAREILEYPTEKLQKTNGGHLPSRIRGFGDKGTTIAEKSLFFRTGIPINAVDTGQLVACFRMLPLTGSEISRSYSAQYYELSGLASFEGKMVEMGRFCVHPDCHDPDILRVAWGR